MTRASREAARQPPVGGLSCGPGQSGAGLRRPRAAAALEWPAAAAGPRIRVWPWKCGRALPSPQGLGSRATGSGRPGGFSKCFTDKGGGYESPSKHSLSLPGVPKTVGARERNLSVQQCDETTRGVGCRTSLAPPPSPSPPLPERDLADGICWPLDLCCFCYLGHLDVTFSLPLTQKFCLDLPKLLICT